MLLTGIVTIVAGIAISLVRGEPSPPCPSDTVTTVELTSTSGVKPLIDALNCTGPGVFSVTLDGRLQIEDIIEMSDQKYVTVAGSAENVLDSSSDASLYAEIDAGHTTGIFLVSNGSTLNMSNLVIEGGYSTDGGAVAVTSSSFLKVFDCIFTNNRASSAGGVMTFWDQHYCSVVTIFVEESF